MALDLSAGMLARAAELNRSTGIDVPLLQADAGALPLATGSVDVVCSAFGGLPFVADVEGALPRWPGCCGPAAGSSPR